MEWEYWIEEIVFGQPVANLIEQLNELGGGEWEAVAAWPLPTVDKPGASICILFKKPKSK